MDKELPKARVTVWLEPCPRCGKKHKWTIGKCHSCGVIEIPVPVSENTCWQSVRCDGCDAYQDHLR